MMAAPTISLAMMSLMQTLAKNDSPDTSAPRSALLKRLEEVATKDWPAVPRESAGIQLMISHNKGTKDGVKNHSFLLRACGLRVKLPSLYLPTDDVTDPQPNASAHLPHTCG